MSGTSSRILRNTGYLYLKMAITVFFSLYTTRLVLASLGEVDYGIFNIVGGAISMLLFLNVAMAGATQRFLNYSEGEGDREKQRKVFNISIVLHVGVALAIGLLLLLSGLFFFHGILNIPGDRLDAAKVIYGSLIVSTLFTVMTVPYDAVINAHENMGYYAVVGILESLLKFGVALLTVRYGGDKLVFYGILMACIPLITMTILRTYCHRKYDECVVSPRDYWDTALFKEMSGYAGWNFLGAMSSVVGNHGNGVVLNHFFGVVLNAALGVANQLNGMLLSFSNSMLKALNPVIVKKEASGDRVSMLRYSFLGCKYSYLLFSIFTVPFLIETPFILDLWLKDVPPWAVIFTRFQIIRTMLEQLTISLATSLAAHGVIKQYNIASLVFNLIQIPILCLLFSMGASPIWYYVVIISVMVIVEELVKLYYTHRLCGMRYADFAVSVLAPSGIVTLAMLLAGLIPHLSLSFGVLRFVLVALMTTLAFILVYLWVTPTDEKREFWKVARSVLKRNA